METLHVAVPALGYASRKTADAMTRSGTERARRMVATGGKLPSLLMLLVMPWALYRERLGLNDETQCP